jgi:RNA polymerase sigma factor (sigma-70 family)
MAVEASSAPSTRGNHNGVEPTGSAGPAGLEGPAGLGLGGGARRRGPDDGDVRLAQGLTDRRSGALAEVYQLHGAAVARQARLRCGDAAMAEDIAQEVFLALWRNPARFDPARGSLRTFLLVLTHHRTIDVFRAEHARRARQDHFYPVTPTAPTAEDDVIQADEASRVRAALETLPSDEREPIALAFFGHHSYREVAQLLGKPEGTVKSRIRAGLLRLRSARELAPALAMASGA